MKLLHLIGEITEETAGPVIRAIDSLTLADNLAVLKIVSEGGKVDYAQAIIASMCAAAVPVHTYASGGVASAAIDVLAFGVTRGVHPLIVAMTHASDTKIVEGKACATIEDQRDRLLYATNLTVLAHWKLLFGKRKRWHRAEDLIHYGFADYISDRIKVPAPAQ